MTFDHLPSQVLTDSFRQFGFPLRVIAAPVTLDEREDVGVLILQPHSFPVEEEAENWVGDIILHLLAVRDPRDAAHRLDFVDDAFHPFLQVVVVTVRPVTVNQNNGVPVDPEGLNPLILGDRVVEGEMG
jgi:hypothetical protein